MNELSCGHCFSLGLVPFLVPLFPLLASGLLPPPASFPGAAWHQFCPVGRGHWGAVGSILQGPNLEQEAVGEGYAIGARVILHEKRACVLPGGSPTLTFQGARASGGVSAGRAGLSLAPPLPGCAASAKSLPVSGPHPEGAGPPRTCRRRVAEVSQGQGPCLAQPPGSRSAFRAAGAGPRLTLGSAFPRALPHAGSGHLVLRASLGPRHSRGNRGPDAEGGLLTS